MILGGYIRRRMVTWRSLRHFPERFSSPPWKLDTRGGQAAAVAHKRLLDEDSESIRLGLQGEKGFGLSQDIDKAGPCHLARFDSVGSSLGLVEVQPTPLVSLTGVYRPTSPPDGFLDAIATTQRPEVSLSRRERQSVEERSSINDFHRGGTSPLQPIRAPGKNCSSGGIPASSLTRTLIDVPLSKRISRSPSEVGTRAIGFRRRRARLRGRGRCGRSSIGGRLAGSGSKRQLPFSFHLGSTPRPAKRQSGLSHP
ncbi:hypothetical protein Salat_2530400 [Sesamum alatum]|uniref:Uncharacterized protein n=1 Tax=Sesamum alatum TaxID=300844 RepID=A0AAE2CCF6_9LAMI|nr:hypothetical protein Salat_2530400 [Sesamum alatum]